MVVKMRKSCGNKKKEISNLRCTETNDGNNIESRFYLKRDSTSTPPYSKNLCKKCIIIKEIKSFVLKEITRKLLTSSKQKKKKILAEKQQWKEKMETRAESICLCKRQRNGIRSKGPRAIPRLIRQIFTSSSDIAGMQYRESKIH